MSTLPPLATVLAGQNSIVTGAGRGIGRGIAVCLANAGANIALNDLTDSDDLQQTAELCRQAGVRTRLALGDVAKQDDIERIIAETIAEFGRLDIAVANAAYSKRELFYAADMAGFEKTIQVTMWGAYYLLRAAAAHMVARGGGGNLVVISSPHAYKAVPGSAAYNMAKAAIDQLARTAATELAAHRIRVNIVHPGWTDTPGERNYFAEEKIQRLAAELPLGRMGRPEEIGRGVVFLCDPASEYITGSTLTIDGGSNLPYNQMHRLELTGKDRTGPEQ